MAEKTNAAFAQRRKRKARELSFQTVITLVTIVFVLLAFIPIFLMIFLSLKSQSQFYANLWAIPNPPQWKNYNAAWNQLIQNMINSVTTVAVGTLLIVLLSAMSGYVFARLEFLVGAVAPLGLGRASHGHVFVPHIHHGPAGLAV